MWDDNTCRVCGRPAYGKLCASCSAAAFQNKMNIRDIKAKSLDDFPLVWEAIETQRRADGLVINICHLIGSQRVCAAYCRVLREEYISFLCDYPELKPIVMEFHIGIMGMNHIHIDMSTKGKFLGPL